MANNSGTDKLTPAMRQYMDAKKDAPEDAILLFRMGDFYELFFEDARIAAPLMDIVLTQRNGVPMCGVPHHALQGYVTSLLEQGRKVAIAEQMEDPKQAKGIVRREVTQIITPGTVLDSGVLAARKSNFLVAVFPYDKRVGIASLDVSTGEFRLTETNGVSELETELNRLQPAEVLLPAEVYETWQSDGFPDAPPSLIWSPLEDWLFDLEMAVENLCRHLGVASLDGYGCRGRDAAIAAAGAVFSYTCNNLRRNADHVTAITFYENDRYMVLDRISQRNLELIEPIFSDASGTTLLAVLDQTCTPMGARLLRDWILRPLRERNPIDQRLEAVQALVDDPLLINELGEALAAVRDLERTIVRLNVGSANARDMLILKRGLAATPGVRTLLDDITAIRICELRDGLESLPALTDVIGRAIIDDPPMTVREGGIIREDYNAELDELRQAATEGKNWIAALQQKEQERTGIKSLKVRFNKVFGYYIEVTKTHLDMIPEDYIRKQTLVNAERFITPELKELENKVLGSEEKSKALEYDLFQELRETVTAHTAEIQRTARALAELDVLLALADIAMKNNYCRPEIFDEPVLDIVDGRHPVLDHFMEQEPFVPNDTLLDIDDNQLIIITGPNMAGKSTYIRQVALLVLMAQMGSFVPAKSAKIGVTDRIFTRVGAADDIARGQSTFMVEMVETANILNNATSQSLIILDEVGRGTSTFDGLSLAWAIAEYLHDNPMVKARTLFATHYHELTELALARNGVKNYNVAVREWGDKVIFLRKILPGSTDKSYGIHVARLAGLPKEVLTRAGEVLSNLEGDALSDIGEPKLARSRRPGKKKKPESPAQPSLFEEL